MIPIATPLLAASLLAGGGLPSPELPSGLPFHAIAFVNDPMSHGAVGDALLSLNEAIRLHNGTLLYPALSPAEQAQLSLIPGTGGTTDVTWIDIDGGDVPLITIEQNLDAVINTSFGLLIKGFGEPPVFDFSGAGVTQGLNAPSNALTIEDVVFHGGPYGVNIVQTDVAGQPGAVLQGVRFENQSQYGLRVTATAANGTGRVIIDQCTFEGVPDAIDYSDTGANRTTIFEVRRTEITAVTNAIQGLVGTGGNARFTFDRLIINNAVQGIVLQLPTSNGRSTLIEGTHTRIRAQSCFEANVAADAPTWINCAMWNLLATGASPSALQIGVLGDQLFGDLNELSCVGDVVIGTGGATQPLTMRNARCRDGSVDVVTSTTQPLVIRESRFIDCQVQTLGPGTVTVEDSCFIGGAFGMVGPANSFVTNNCFIGNGGGALISSQNLPAPQLGNTFVTPDDVSIGATINLGVDLPNGLAALLVLGVTGDPAPASVLPAPFWLYVDPVEFVIVPGVYRFQQSFPWTVPNLSQFVGAEFVLQAVVLPDPGMQAPWLQMPPGWRFVLR